MAHDDRLDALSMAVAYWVEQMAADVDKAMNDRYEDLLDDTLEKFATNSLLKKDEGVSNQWFVI